MDYLKGLMNLPNTLMASRRRPNLPPAKRVLSNPYNGERFDVKKNLMNKMNHPVQVLPNGNVVMSNGNIVNGKAVLSHSNVSNSNSSPVRKIDPEKVLLSNGNSINVKNQKLPAFPVGVVNKHVLMSNGNTISPQVIAQIPQELPNGSNTQTEHFHQPARSFNIPHPSRSPSPMPRMEHLRASSPPPMPRMEHMHRRASPPPMPRMEHMHRRASPPPMPTRSPSRMEHMHMSRPPRPSRSRSTSVERLSKLPRYERLNGNTMMNSMMTVEDECPIAPPSKPRRYCRPAPFHSTAGEKYFYVGEAYGAPVAG